MSKQSWRGSTLLNPEPPVLVSCGGGSGFRRVLPFQLCLLIRDTSFRREPMCAR